MGSTLWGTTLPRGGGAGGALSLPDIQQILIVDKTAGTYAPDGTQQRPFNSIGAAVTAAVALAPTTTNRILIYIHPGIYEEAVAITNDFIYLQGEDRDTTIITSDTVTLGITADEVSVSDLTIHSEDAFYAIGLNGSFNEFVRFFNCLIDVGDPDGYVFIEGGASAWFERCDWIVDDGAGGDPALATDDDASNRVVLNDCTISGGYIDFDGGALTVRDGSISSDSANGCVRLTDANVGVVTLDSVHFIGLAAGARKIYVTAAPTQGIVRNCLFDSGANNPDIDSTVALTGWIIEGNVMEAGIDSNVSHVAPTRYVGAAGDVDFYAAIQDALDACTFDDITVHLLQDFTIAAALTPPSRPVIIDGHGFTITRAAGSPAITIGSSDDLETRDVNIVGSIDFAPAQGGATLLLGPGTVLTGMLDVQSGDATATVDLDGATVNGDASDNYCIRLADADPVVTIKRSYLKGNSGNVAIYWDTVTNDDLQLAWSTVIHGSVGANNPFGRSGAQTPDYKSHHDAYNSDPEAGAIWTNLVAAGQRFDSLDVNTDY